jgi:hypothetical protein
MIIAVLEYPQSPAAGMAWQRMTQETIVADKIAASARLLRNFVSP